MKKLIFHLSNFFGSGHFLIHEILKNRPKNDRSQKSYFKEKSVFSCSSTSRRNFWILFMPWLYFHDWFLKLYEVISKLCDLGGCSYLDNKCSPCLCLPAIRCTKLGMKYGFPLTFNSQYLWKFFLKICFHHCTVHIYLFQECDTENNTEKGSPSAGWPR